MTEYKYITPDVIEAGTIVVPNAEAYKEAEEYNLRMNLLREKKDRWRRYCEFYRTLNIISLIVAFFCLIKPVIFSGDEGNSIIGTFIAAIGYGYIIVRYIFRRSLFSKTVSENDYNAAMNSSGISDATTLMIAVFAAFVLNFAIKLAFSGGFIVNLAFSFLMFAVYILVFIFYITNPIKYRVWASVIIGVIPFMITPVLLFYSLAIVIVGVSVDVKVKEIRDETGFPEFSNIIIKTNPADESEIKGFDEYSSADSMDNI